MISPHEEQVLIDKLGACYCSKRKIGLCVLCAARKRVAAGDSIESVLKDYNTKGETA